GRGQRLSVKNYGEGPVYVFTGKAGKTASAVGVEGNIDDRLVGPLIEALPRVNQAVPANAAKPAHRDGSPLEIRAFRIRHDLAAGRSDALLDVGLQGVHVDQLEF